MIISKEISASPDSAQWQSINWKAVEARVLKLQMRIAKATRDGKHGKAKALQWILTHSRSAKLLAVKRVSQNKGSKTPGNRRRYLEHRYAPYESSQSAEQKSVSSQTAQAYLHPQEKRQTQTTGYPVYVR